MYEKVRRNGRQYGPVAPSPLINLQIAPVFRPLVYDEGHFLGRGAFGQIYKVQHKLGGQNGEELALKYARPVEVIQRIPLHTYEDLTYKVGEIKALLLLRNVPNILQIREFYFNFMEIRNAPLALVTELMKGEDLDKWMKGRANMAEGVTEVTASDISRALLGAVRHMHQRNIVHRDLKVSNLRITVRGPRVAGLDVLLPSRTHVSHSLFGL